MAAARPVEGAVVGHQTARERALLGDVGLETAVAAEVAGRGVVAGQAP